MLPEKRRTAPVQWAILVTVLVQIFLSFFWAGRLAQQIQDVADRVGRIERYLDEVRGKN